MKRILVAILFFLGTAFIVNAQSTTVSGQVTDTGAQTWNNGTFSFQFVPNPQFPNIASYTWTGGTLPQTVSGSLNGAGHYSTSVPSNSVISPQGSKWILSVCPQATWPCFISANTTITGGSQTLNVTPSVIAINLMSPGPFTRAYADSEIASAVIAAQYYNLTTQTERICQAVVGQTCITWADIGGATSGGGVNPSTQFASAYYNTSTTIAGIPASPPTVNGSYLCGYDISGSVASAPSCDQVGLSARAVTGATATDTVLYTDNNSSVEYKGSVAVATSLPTPTTLTNPFFYTVLDNLTTGVSTSVTVTPVTFTINGAATLVITQNQRCLIQVDPALATNWLASCTGGGAGASPRLDQVLDPRADKAFEMLEHKMTFNFIAASADSNPLFVIPNEPDPIQANSVVHIGPDASLFSPYSLEGFNSFEAGSLQGTAFEAQTQQSPSSALAVAAGEILVNATRTGGFGTSLLVYETTSGTNNIDSLFAFDVAALHSSTGTLSNLYGLHFGTPAITAGGTITNAYGVKIEDQTAAANNFAIKTGLGKVELGTVTGGTSGQLSYDPAASGSFPNLVLKAQDNSNMFRIFGGTGAAVPPQIIQFIGPSPSLTGSFSSSTGSRVDMLSGNDGAAAPATQDIFLHHDFGATTNGSGLTGNQVNLSMDAGDGQNPSGTKQAYAFQAIVTNSVNNGISQGFIADVACSGTPCTAHAFDILNGDLGLNGSAGTTGQVATSAGPNAIPNWTTPASTQSFSDTKTAQVAAITDTTMVTVGGTTALYRFTGTINCTTTSAAATATLNLKYTDSASTVQTVSVTDTCTALVTSGIPNLVVGLRAKNATAITYGVTIANTPTYDVDVRLEKM